MPSGSDKWIRPIRDNPAGKVVADPEGNRWEWQSDEETAHLLKKLNNDELSIERTDIRPSLKEGSGKSATAAKTPAVPNASERPRPSARDKGGGFNPYDHPGKPRRR